MNEGFRHVDLFSGIGGFALAVRTCGGRTVLFVEKDQYCQRVLRKHWPAVPIMEDVRYVTDTGERIAGTVDLLTGGFPCQPFSTAGRRGGVSDDRYLWPEMLRVVRLLKPTWVIAENVAGLISMAQPYTEFQVESRQAQRFLGSDAYHSLLSRQEILLVAVIIQDLERAGYRVPELLDGTPVILCIPACAVGAPHRRDRVWIVGYSESERRKGKAPGGQQEQAGGSSAQPEIVVHSNSIDSIDRCNSKHGRWEDVDGHSVEDAEREENANEVDGSGEDVADTSKGFSERVRGTRGRGIGSSDQCRWSPEPGVGRMANGVPNRVDRLRGLGNAIVPQVAERIIRAMVRN